jgi:hypothetical protein
MVKKLVIPEGSPQHNDVVDVVIQSATKDSLVEQKDGTFLRTQVIDGESLWWKMGKVDSEKFGGFAFELKELERMAKEAFNNMCFERATQFHDQIIDFCQSFRSSIDAKGSESRRDKHNAKQTILDTLGRQRSEKIYTIEDKMKSKGLGAFFGGNKARDEIADD